MDQRIGPDIAQGERQLFGFLEVDAEHLALGIPSRQAKFTI